MPTTRPHPKRAASLCSVDTRATACPKSKPRQPQNRHIQDAVQNALNEYKKKRTDDSRYKTGNQNQKHYFSVFHDLTLRVRTIKTFYSLVVLAASRPALLATLAGVTLSPQTSVGGCGLRVTPIQSWKGVCWLCHTQFG